MTPHYADDWLTVYLGDCREVMAQMEPESVHCVVTSPPFWGLRDYGVAGQLGLEPTPEAYVESLVAVFREVRRVLRSDGTVWLNLGDSYASTAPGTRNAPMPKGSQENAAEWANWRPETPPGLKPKDLVGIPWRVAFALQADGWYLRSDIIWSKPNPMPESVTDRPTKAHEYLFLLSKSPRYYFDADAVREPHIEAHLGRYGYDFWPDGTKEASGNGRPDAASNTGGMKAPNPLGRNLRSVWTIATQPYPGAHFATFPAKLVKPCIKAGTSERGVCSICGAPWVRLVNVAKTDEMAHTRAKHLQSSKSTLSHSQTGHGAWAEHGSKRLTMGWKAGCPHRVSDDADMVPATVLDPFAGSGTTGMVAQSLSRKAVLIDLSADYLRQLMGRNRDIPLGLKSA